MIDFPEQTNPPPQKKMYQKIREPLQVLNELNKRIWLYSAVNKASAPFHSELWKKEQDGCQFPGTVFFLSQVKNSPSRVSICPTDIKEHLRDTQFTVQLVCWGAGGGWTVQSFLRKVYAAGKKIFFCKAMEGQLHHVQHEWCFSGLWGSIMGTWNKQEEKKCLGAKKREDMWLKETRDQTTHNLIQCQK